MNKKKRASGRIKDIVIVLLLLSAVFWGWKSRLFGNSSAQMSDVFSMFENVLAVAEEQAEDETLITEAAKPLCIVVTNADGEHYGVKYDMDEIGVLYSKTVLIFSEALVSATAAERVTEAQWRQALMSGSVYFKYASPVKLSVLDGWYGSEITGGWSAFSVSRLCVVDEGETCSLYFIDEDTGDYYAAVSSVSSRIAELADSVGINSTFFAFELDSGYLSPGCYTLLKLDETGYPVLEAVNPMEEDDALESVLMNLGISEYQESSYTEGDGTRVFVDEDFTVSLKTDGTMIYTRTDSSEQTASMDESEAIEFARALVASTLGENCGSDTGIYFDCIETDDTGSYRVCFRYVVAGGLVQLGDDRYAADVTVRGGALAEMTLCFRNYTVTSELVQLLPETQTAAASGGAFLLCYLDDGSDIRLEPVWIIPETQEN